MILGSNNDLLHSARGMVAWCISLSWVSQGRFIAHDTSLFVKIAVIGGDIFSPE
jgi:hypothetical protein